MSARSFAVMRQAILQGRAAEKVEPVQADRLLALWAHAADTEDATPEQFIAAAHSLGLMAGPRRTSIQEIYA